MPLGLFVGLGVSVATRLCVRVIDKDTLGEAAEEPVTEAVLVTEVVKDGDAESEEVREVETE